MESTYIPVLSIPGGVMNIDFYRNALGATELWRISNDDGSVHVAAFSIGGAEFRLHEGTNSPDKVGGTTVTIALNTIDVQGTVASAVAAGATLTSPVTDWEYGYRQGVIKDPFGHLWQIEKLLSKESFNQFLNQLPKP